VSVLSIADLAAVADTLRDAARREIIPRFRRLADDAVRQKSGPLDLVTEADEAAERVITDGLRRAFPGCAVVGEEAAERDPSLLRALASADLAFAVDPIDGTSNFAWGMPLFGCMAAAIRRGDVVASVIHDPIVGANAMALRGEGAWSEEADGRRHDLRVAAPVPLAEMTGTASWRFLPEPQRSTVGRNLVRVAASFVYRCAAHEYRLAAAGYCHYLVFGKLMPWDHAPGWLLHREAGGYSAMFDGAPYSVGVHAGGLICAPDRESWRALKQALLEG
jgi:fructose-1,6-bisphosphatase/inositol monophosphatase family enzyme